MARQPTPRSTGIDPDAPQTTGRYLVLMDDAAPDPKGMLNNIAGLSLCSTDDFQDPGEALQTFGGADGVMFEHLGVAVVDAPPEQAEALSVSASGAVLAVEPERIVHALTDLSSAQTANYLRGFRDGVNQLYGSLYGADTDEQSALGAVAQATLTWGLQAIGVGPSPYSGRGVRVAVLDTGMDLRHPDFLGRAITSRSFISGEAVQDLHGHGTHCIGTACGPRLPGAAPRYGIAYEAEIYAGKVLSNAGSGSDGGILAGIDWAVANGCAVISMSLGARVGPGAGYSAIFETAAQRALAAGTLIIAAAGNESRRPTLINPVGHPANCPSIMAVGATDVASAPAFFSNGGLNGSGGEVDIAGPGVDVRSSWPEPARYNSISGTSMATPHVAGVAALLAQQNPGHRGTVLRNLLIRNARRLPLPARDVGAGLVQV